MEFVRALANAGRELMILILKCVIELCYLLSLLSSLGQKKDQIDVCFQNEQMICNTYTLETLHMTLYTSFFCRD